MNEKAWGSYGGHDVKEAATDCDFPKITGWDQASAVTVEGAGRAVCVAVCRVY